MPIDDWTKVTAGTFHAFHLALIGELQRSLNSGLLPPNYYALAEQVATRIIPYVLTLQDIGAAGDPTDTEETSGNDDGGVAVATAAPLVAVGDKISESMLLAARRRRIAIRHTTGDRVVAFLEIESPGNKEKPGAVDQFVEKAANALNQDIHL